MGIFRFGEHNGKRILFDTGNDAAIFEHNVKALGVDLTKLDFVVISHRHGDHTTELRYVLKVNPNVTVCVPADWRERIWRSADADDVFAGG